MLRAEDCAGYTVYCSIDDLEELFRTVLVSPSTILRRIDAFGQTRSRLDAMSCWPGESNSISVPSIVSTVLSTSSKSTEQRRKIGLQSVLLENRSTALEIGCSRI